MDGARGLLKGRMKKRWKQTGGLAVAAGALFFFARHLEVRWLAQAEAEAVPRASKALIETTRASVARATAVPAAAVRPFVAKTSSGKIAPDKLTDEDLYCLAKGAGVALSGDVRFNSTVLFDGRKNWGTIILVSSSACPRESYSIVRFDSQGRLNEKTMDCRTTPLAQTILEYGRQWNVVDATPVAGEENFAISGGGYFVKHCGDAGVMITRDGRFRYNEEGILVDESGECEVRSSPTRAAPRGGPIAMSDGALDENGCQANGVCLSVIDPVMHGAKNYAFVDDRHLRGNEETLSRGRIGGLHLFRDAYEDLDDASRGMTGFEKPERWSALQREPDCSGFRADQIDWSARPSYASP